MKIALISDGDPSDYKTWSGIVYNITRQLKKENEVVWISPKTSAVFLLISMCYRLVCKLFVIFGYFSTHLHTHFYAKLVSFFISKQIENKQYDLIFAFGSFNIAYLKTSVPIIFCADAVYHQMIDYYWKNLPSFFKIKGDLIEKAALMNASLNIFPSEWVINCAKDYYHIDSKKMEVIEFGANIDYKEISFNVRKFNCKSLKIIFIGVDLIRKGIDIALEVNFLLKNKYGVASSLHVVGDKMCDAKYSDNSVNWIGFLDKNNSEDCFELERLLSDADIFLLPTKAECAGIVFAEASAYGLPIFTYDTGGISNYVVNGLNGYRLNMECRAIDFADRIYKSLSTEELPTLSNGGYQLFREKLNWDCWMKRVNTVVQSKVI